MSSRSPVQVTLRQGRRAATEQRTVTVVLPTAIVPGDANELSGRDDPVLTAFRRHGTITGVTEERRRRDTP